LAVSSYAAYTDVFGTAGYLRDPSSTANSAIMAVFLAESSRLIDEEAGQFFYADGYYAQHFTGEGMSHIDTGQFPFFGSSGTIGSISQGATSVTFTTSPLCPTAPAQNNSLIVDTGSLKEVLTINGAVTGTGPYTVPVTATAFAHAASTVATTFKIDLRYFENQPQGQVIVGIDGDGITPPSNFYLWPINRPRIGAANQSTPDTTSRFPYKGIDIAHIPISSTTFLPSSIPGYKTVSITANWGWPAVPDFIKDLTCRAASLMWRKRMAGQGDTGGATGTTAGIGDARALIKTELAGTRYKQVYI
jgi:hypothetical protein